MRLLDGPLFDRYRVPLARVLDDMRKELERAPDGPHAWKWRKFIELNKDVKDDIMNGMFDMLLGDVHVHVVAACGGGWDHVSVSTRTRTPTWEEMELVKHIFFKETETAMQLHVPADKHINIHQHTLHLWRPHKGRIPMPPRGMV